MKQIDKPIDLVNRLQTFEAFEGIADSSLQWLIDQADYVLYENGEQLFFAGMKTDQMQVIVEGEYIAKIEQQGEFREIGVFDTGNITGVLPFSRMQETRAVGRALKDTYVLELHRRHFVEMVNVDYGLVQNLVALMSNRIRNFTQLQVHNEKLMALGKLSAGLAHELNNPASAMTRSAQELHSKIHTTPEKFKSIITMRITDAQTDQINELLFAKIKAGTNEDLPALQRSQIEDDILDWLDDHDIDHGEDIANTFTDYSFTAEDLDQVEQILEGQNLGPILWWLESTLSLETLIGEIRESADRISTLVRSVKDYSHMDRSGAKDPVQVKDGIYSTLMILKHKVKKKQIILHKSFPDDLPPILAHVSELNQVWTNIIDNALDALPENGELTIQARVLRQFVCVEIIDNGPGIPENVINNIFDPFFTTKGVGEGTGMGLDITKRIVEGMKGQIHVSSKPGQTSFQILLPITHS
ncbi:MAG: cyclic nucleotide-binding domain-containing protein [Saprospiraceae bacterium]|nr:cyclic nucleotide-binding domain-containing protein [Saprospiraceae bacterium]